MKKITCYIKARHKGSKRVPQKMLRPFADSCLLGIALENILKCKNLDRDRIFLGSAEKEITEVGKQLGINIYHRSKVEIKEFQGTGETPGWAVENLKKGVYSKFFLETETDYFLTINPCNPLLSYQTIDKAIDFFQNNDVKSLFGVVKRPNFFFDMKSSELLNKFNGPRELLIALDTRLIEPVYEAAHSIYIFNSKYIKNNPAHNRWSFTKNDPFLFEIPPEEAFDIDYPWQFDLAEAMYRQRNLKNANKKSFNI